MFHFLSKNCKTIKHPMINYHVMWEYLAEMYAPRTAQSLFPFTKQLDNLLLASMKEGPEA